MAIYAKAGDTFFTHSDTLLGNLIRWGEKDCKEKEPTWTNHTGVVVRDGWLAGVCPNCDDASQATIIEALWHTRRGPFDGKSEIRVFRPIPAYTPEELLRFATKANHYVGDHYGWWKLGGFLLKRVTCGAIDLPRLYFIDNKPICSYLTGETNEAARKRGSVLPSQLVAEVNGLVWPGFGMPANAGDPDEMMDFCLKHPEFWMEVK